MLATPSSRGIHRTDAGDRLRNLRRQALLPRVPAAVDGAEPLNAPGKELCDVLVVCDPDVIIFSVKDIRLQTETAPEVGAERWRRRAIDSSVNQLYGATRWLRRGGRVVRADGSPGLALPSPGTMRVHRIAVALGSDSQAPFQQGEFARASYTYSMRVESTRYRASSTRSWRRTSACRSSIAPESPRLDDVPMLDENPS
jgi:hypothetical protein